MYKYSLIVLLSLSSHFLIAQKIVYQDIVNGGVTGGAYNAGFTSQAGQIDVYIEPGSAIKKALLFVNSHFNPYGNRSFVFNNTVVTFDQTFAEPEVYLLTTITGNLRLIKTLVFDVTELVSTNQITYTIIPPEVISPIQTNGSFNEFYLYVVYENQSMPALCAVAAINDVQPSGMMSYSFSDLNTISSNENVSLAINSSNICDTIQDGSYVLIDDSLIGLIGGPDDHSISFCTGVVGSFFYQNNTLFGLGNDIANSTMSGPDAIANIENYIVSNNSLLIDFVYQSNYSPQSNTIHQLFLTYTSPCQPFSTNLLTSDTTTCPNAPVQLGASGGITYDWLPQTNLSCYNCPNPVFLGDSTTNYTVRIWASDSCSKVLPVRVRVSTCASLDELGSAFEIFAPTLVHGDLGTLYQIRIKNVQQYQYELYTLEGKVVYQKNGFPESATIDLWDKALMESGLYLYRILVRDEAGNQEVSGGKVVVVR